MKSNQIITEYEIKQAILASEDPCLHVGVDRFLDHVSHYGKIDHLMRTSVLRDAQGLSPRSNPLNFFPTQVNRKGV